MLKVGVAIPCYIYHLPKLRFLLESIVNQTVKPDYVVVSCSSTKSDNVEVQQLLSTYSQKFTLTILTTQERKNASENRNIASRYLRELQVDIISYIDADDLMCSQRLEFIKSIFEKTRCPFICDCFVFHTLSGDIRTFRLSIKYKSYPTFYDTILVPIFEKYCAENNIELKIIKRDIYG